MTIEMKNKLSMFLKMQIRLSRFYLQLASIAKVNHLNNLAIYLKMLSKDKITTHKDLVFNYLNDLGIKLDLENTPCGLKDTVKAKLMEVKSIQDIFELITYSEGTEVKNRIDDVVTLAMNEHDYLTLDFMQWFIDDYNTDYSNEWTVIYDAFMLEYKRNPNTMNLLEVEKVIAKVIKQMDKENY